MRHVLVKTVPGLNTVSSGTDTSRTADARLVQLGVATVGVRVAAGVGIMVGAAVGKGASVGSASWVGSWVGADVGTRVAAGSALQAATLTINMATHMTLNNRRLSCEDIAPPLTEPT